MTAPIKSPEEIAREIAEHTGVAYPTVRNALIEKIAAALSQVERDALASKVVFPPRERLLELFKESDDQPEVFFKKTLKEIKLAPSEQVIRVPRSWKFLSDPRLKDLERLNKGARIEESDE